MENTIPQRRFLTFFVLLLLVATGAGWGCSNDGVESPQMVARTFLNDLRLQKHEEVLDAIWPETRAELQRGFGAEEQEQILVATRVKSTFLLERIDVVGELPESPSLGDEAKLHLQFRDGREATMTLRFGEERWYVDLPLEESRELRLLPDPKSDDLADAPVEDDEEEASQSEQGGVDQSDEETNEK